VNKLIPWFTKNYPILVADLTKCQHGFNGSDRLNPYHLEGSVWSHTLLVCNQIPSFAKIEIKLAALLHDIGKIKARQEKPEKNKTTFYSHHNFSAFMAIEILEKYEEDFGWIDKELVFKLIAHHQDMHLLSVDQLKERFVNQTMFMNDLEILHKADSLGRICMDNKEYKSDIYLGFNEKENWEKSLVIMVGLPCSGKSSFAELIDHFSENSVIICRDTILQNMYPELSYNDAFAIVDQKLVNKKFNEELEKAKKTAETIIIDKTNMTKKARKRMLNGFGDEWGKEAVVMLPSMLEIRDRNCRRSGKYIEGTVFNKMISSFSNPTYDDFDIISYMFEEK
jgi:putative nucleotidyltransferase with HDIG domain